MNETVLEVLKYGLPVLSALGGAYLLHYIMSDKQAKEAEYQLRLKVQDKVLPLRLTAYERCILYLERIQPYSSFLRIKPQDKTLGIFQEQLLKEIQEEFEYNVVQQLYVSPVAWKALVQTKNKYIELIETLGKKYMPHEPALELANAILLAMKEPEQAPPFHQTIETFKKELTTLFF